MPTSQTVKCNTFRTLPKIAGTKHPACMMPMPLKPQKNALKKSRRAYFDKLANLLAHVRSGIDKCTGSGKHVSARLDALIIRREKIKTAIREKL